MVRHVTCWIPEIDFASCALESLIDNYRSISMLSPTILYFTIETDIGAMSIMTAHP